MNTKTFINSVECYFCGEPERAQDAILMPEEDKKYLCCVCADKYWDYVDDHRLMDEIKPELDESEGDVL